MLVPHLSLAHP